MCIRDRSYTPALLVSGYDDPWLWVGSICWFVFLSIPVAVDVVEEMRWHGLRSKIEVFLIREHRVKHPKAVGSSCV